MKKHFFFGAIFLFILSLPILAQTTNQTTTPSQTTNDANEKNSDLVITATVKAKELKFEVVPNPTVEFPGNKPRQTVWEADRTNLPKPVEPGVVYRDIGIRLRIFSRFSEIQRIVLEALDEENPPPAVDSNPPPNQNAPTNNTPPPPTNSTNQTNKATPTPAKSPR